MKIKFGIIGLGGRGGNFAKELSNYKKAEFDISALCDVNPGVIEDYEKFVKEHLGHGCKHYLDYKDLIADPNVDAVMIGTPDQFHHEMAIAAFKAGKDVFLEKPVGTNLDEMIEIVREGKKANRIIEIGYVLRYTPFYGKIKEIIESGILGRILFVQADEYYSGGAGVFFRDWWQYRKNIGGIMIQKICHDLDLMYWFFGKPTRIAAFESRMEYKDGNWPSNARYCHECENRCPYYKRANPHKKQSDQCIYNNNDRGTDISDNAQVLIQFENGLNLTQSMHFFPSKAQDGRHIRIVGSKAELTGHFDDQIIRIDSRFGNPEDYETTKMIRAADGALLGHGGGDSVQIQKFLDALVERKESLAGYESAYWSSIMVMAAQIAADTKKVVEIEELIKKYPFPE